MGPPQLLMYAKRGGRYINNWDASNGPGCGGEYRPPGRRCGLGRHALAAMRNAGCNNDRLEFV